MAQRYVEKGWEAYRRVMLPARLGERSEKHLRRAYYAGAAVLFETIVRTLDPGDEPTAADLERMGDIQRELDEFGQQLDAEVLGAMTRH